jgi:hypothetical protein
MKGFALLAAMAAMVSAPAMAERYGAWNSSFGQGIQEYSTGTWDAKSGAALLFNCNTVDDTASLMVQIAGVEPPAGTMLAIAVSGRNGATHRFKVNGQGAVEFGPAAASAPAGRLWAALRNGSGVTLRYADGTTGRLSLAGAARALPAKVCG